MRDPSPVRAVDSSVLLRYLLDDVPDQSERARRLVESDSVLSLTAVALAEVAWTLVGPRYRIDRRDVACQLTLLLARENVVTLGLDTSEAEAALARCALEVGAANFGDALIAA
jgi:predicted nucleic acid-binding protein